MDPVTAQLIIPAVTLIIGAFILGLIIMAAFKRKHNLEPGICECGEPRCVHRKGKWECCATVAGKQCECMIYIRDDKGGGGGNEDPILPDTPSVKDLERMFK